MKQRIITAAVLIAVVLPMLLVGGVLLDILIVAFTLLACYETLNLFGSSWSNAIKLPVYVMFLVADIVAIAFPTFFEIPQAILIVYLFTVVVFDKKTTVDQAGLVFMLFCIVYGTVVAINQMMTLNKLMIFYPLFATYLTDAFAYFTGRAFGKHKLNERISPKKTIEGTIGGYIFGFVGSLLFGLLVLTELPVWFVVAGSVIMPLVGQIGDLAFSAIKRHYCVKDFGWIFPGHGGVLDRIDSLTFNCLVMHCLFLFLL